jgi:cytidylate kinase
VAKALGYRHVDTGAMYRAVAWRAIRDGLAWDDEAAVSSLASRIRIEASDRTVLVDGQDITSDIRTPAIDLGATRVARIAGVRAALVEQQRAMGNEGGVVMEGRDIGTVVFPAAPVKIYLDAAPEVRARRRVLDQSRTGTDDLAKVATEMAARDESDRTRAVAPLAVAADAHAIDTTGLTIDQVVKAILDIVEQA